MINRNVSATGIFAAGLLTSLLAGAVTAVGVAWLRSTTRKAREEEYDRGWLDGVTGRPPARAES